MNLDFILFSAPRAKYTFVDFWGETIFIPNYTPITRQKSNKTYLFSTLTNCYNASKTHDVYFSIDGALSQQNGQMSRVEQIGVSTTDSVHEQQQISHYIPCLFLNSMVASKYLIMYFHASGEDIKTAHGLLNYLRNSYQVNVLAMEYPGYSIYKGSVSAQQVNSNARIVYDFVVKKLGFQERNIIVIGRSIGAGVALELLKKKKQSKAPNPRCLVLISPFASVKNLVKQFVGRLGTLFAKQVYDNLQNMMEVKCPVFVVHGKKDTFISLDHSKQLMKNCYNRKCLIAPQNMTHATFDYYSDLIDPLREFLIEQGINFYEQNMKGPTIPEQLFKCPQNYKF